MRTLKYILAIVICIPLWATNTLVHSALDIHNAMGALLPGDTLTMANGVWQGQRISLHAQGSESNPIVIIAETPGLVVLNGFSTLEFSGSYIEINGLNFNEGYSMGDPIIEFRRGSTRANHCRLTNTTISNYNPGSINTDYKWVSLYGQNNQVDHCYFTGKNHSGTTLVVWLTEAQDRDNHHLIEYNYFGYRPPLDFNGGETIRIGTSDYSMTNSRTMVRHNLFERCDGEIEIISNKSCENIYFNNTFIDNEGMLTLRHGERCLVEGNFFFGAGNSDAGGVRIIGADHIVINNYFQDLISTGYRSAIVFVTGVEDSPLNRYFQVENAMVAHNTLINCRQSFLMGYGTSDDQNLPPINCTIANNAVFAGNYTVFHTGDTEELPQNFTYQQNMVMGSQLGIPDTSDGIIWQNPMFEQPFPATGLIRPTAASPLIGQAAALSYAVTTDMDGQVRGPFHDIGADEVSTDPIIYGPLTAADVGPDWLNTVSHNQYIEAGLNTLVSAVEASLPGDTLFLMGDEYTLSEAIAIDTHILILPDPDLAETPVIRPVTALSRLFDIQGGGSLRLSGVTIDGGGPGEYRTQRVFHANYNNLSQLYSLNILNVNFRNLGAPGDYAVLLEANPGSLADSLNFKYCDFQDINGTVFLLDVTADESGVYSARHLELEDCTFWNISKQVLSIYGGDSNPFSVGPLVMINHCTFYYCGYDNVPVVDARHVDVATIKNSIFSESSQFSSLIELYSWSQILYSDVHSSGDIILYPNVSLGAGILYENPQFSNAAEGVFTLSPESVLYDHPGTESVAYGDRRRHDPSVIQSVHPQPVREFSLIQNYPNPFNGGTNLRLTLEQSENVTIQLFDLTGGEIMNLLSQNYPAGKHDIHLQLKDLESGIYVCQASFGAERLMTKMTVIK